jgi:hypothetical protein
VSARKKRHRGKYLNRRDQPRTDQTNNPVNHGNGVPADAAVKQQPLRLGQVSLVPSARSTEGPPSESRKARALQQFGPSHAQAEELGAAKLSRTLSASTSAFSRAQPTRTPIWKVVVVLFITMGIVALARMKESPLLNFGWRESDRTAASASLSLQDRALHGGPSLRLAIQEVRGISGEPLPLGTSLEGVTNHAVVIVRGLVAGMTLSTGSAFGANAWRVPASEFADAWIGPPKDFSGVVDVTAELYLPDQTVADRRRLRLVRSAPPRFPPKIAQALWNRQLSPDRRIRPRRVSSTALQIRRREHRGRMRPCQRRSKLGRIRCPLLRIQL